MSARQTPALTDPCAETLRDWYRKMLLIRRFEEKAGQLYGMGLIGGFCHLCIGQEAVATGLEACARPGDARLTSYRNHGLMLACGMDPDKIMAELLGRASGYSRGKGGSMHMFSPEHGFFGGHGIVGAQVPIGTGLAFAQRYRKQDAVTFCYFGERAADQGQVAESYALAAQWKLPIVYVIENNQLGATTPSVASEARPQLADRSKAYGIRAERVDGMDVRAVHAAGQRATEHARSGKGPVVLEMRIARYRGHSMSDPAKYRTPDEVARMRDERDPIALLRAQLLEEGHASEDDLKIADRAIKDQVSAAAEFARTSAEPPANALLTDVTAAPSTT